MTSSMFDAQTNKWVVPAHDPLDPSHEIELSQALDDKSVQLSLEMGGNVSFLSIGEACQVAIALLDAAEEAALVMRVKGMELIHEFTTANGTTGRWTARTDTTANLLREVFGEDGAE